MDAFRKQLDALMGANRNGDVDEVQRNYYERDVCRAFLAGLCPHDLFTLTKMDLGQCSRIHSLQLRKEYEEAKSKGKADYDRELETILDKMIMECDRKIARSFKRLEDDEGAQGANAVQVSHVTESPESKEFTKKIYEKMAEVDQLDLEGKTDDKIRAEEELEKLKQDRADKQAQALLDAFNRDRLSGPPPAGASAALPPPPPGPPPLGNVPDAKTQEMIAEKMRKAEECGEEGRVDEAQKLLEEAEALKKLGANALLVRPTPAPPSGLNIQIRPLALRVPMRCP